MKKRLSLLGLTAVALCACDAKKEPIIGTRIAVVEYESSVKVDSDAKDITVLLPQPEIGRDWAQVGAGAEHGMPHVSLNDKLTPKWV